MLLPHYSKNWNRLFLVLLAFALLAPLPFCFRQDYGVYVHIWQNIVEGGNPWFFSSGMNTGNSYGPLFGLFAWPYMLYSHLPQMLFILIWFGISRMILNEHAASATATGRSKKGLFAFFWLSPFFWIDIASYGHFDIVVAAVCWLAILRQTQGRDIQSAIYLAIGISLKIYPIFILPFLIWDRRGWHGRLLAVVVGLTAGIFLVSYGIWGDAIFFPFQFTQARPSSYLSIFRFIRGVFSPWPNLDFLATGLLGLAWGGWVLRHGFRRYSSLYASMIAFLIAFMVFKVSHPQFYTVLFILVPYWWVRESKQAGKLSRRVTQAWFAPLVFISFSDFLFVATRGFQPPRGWLDDLIGLPFFLIQVGALVLILRDLRRFPNRGEWSSS